MGRGRRDNDRPSRKLTESELLGKFAEGLDILEQLCGVYDKGYSPIVFPMANEVHKILVDNDAATRARGKRAFTTPDFGNETQMLNALHKLCSVRIGGEPPEVTFFPQFYGGSQGVKSLQFRDWWNRDVIYRASAAKPGTAPGLIPVRLEDQFHLKIETNLPEGSFYHSFETRLLLTRTKTTQSYSMRWIKSLGLRHLCSIRPQVDSLPTIDL